MPGSYSAEKDLSTEEDSQEARAWLSKENEHPWRAACLENKTAQGSPEINCGMMPEADGLRAVAVRGEQYLTKAAQYGLVYKKGSSWVSSLLVMKTLPNNGLDLSRYGFSVSRRVGKAVVRNRVRRLLREILRQTPLQPGWDIIFIVRSPAASANYVALRKTVRDLLFRARLSAGDYEEVCSRTN